MRNSIKLAALGVAGAGAIAGTVAGIRWLRARRANQPLDLDAMDIDATDFGEPVVVAEEFVIITEPFDSELEAVPAGGLK
jgi:hypothetical protein